MRSALLLLLLWGFSSGPLAGERLTTVPGFDWEYTPHPELVAFYLYVSRQSGVYDFSQPTASVPALPEMLTELSPGDLALPGPGTYYVVVRAMHLSGRDEHHSGPSNEVSFVYGQEAPVPPLPPIPPWTPVPPQIPPRVPPPHTPERPPLPPPPSPDGHGGVPDHCMWKGGEACQPKPVRR